MNTILNKVFYDPDIRDDKIKETINKIMNDTLTTNELYKLSSDYL